MLLNINKQLVEFTESLLKTASGDVSGIQNKMNRITQAINSGKLNEETLAKAGLMLAQLANQLVKMQ